MHISEVTLSFLGDGFEVEPAHGEKREEILRIAGIKTYFIVRPIKPVRNPLIFNVKPSHTYRRPGLDAFEYLHFDPT